MNRSTLALITFLILTLLAAVTVAQNGPGDCDGTGPNGTAECDGTGPHGPGNGAGNGPGNGAGNGPHGSGNGPGNGPYGTGTGNCDGTGPHGRGGGNGYGQSGCCTAYLASLPVSDLSADETAGLVYMREEEKLARDVYLGLALEWKLTPFDNIARAEQRHMESVGFLLERYGLEDPVGENGIGVFQDVTLQQLYDELLARGKKSLVDALTVGATIEDLDIFDVEQRLATTDSADVAAVYQNLAKGSRNHLRAFTALLTDSGAPYSAQYITDSYLEDILASGWERGVVYDGNGQVATTCGRGPRG